MDCNDEDKAGRELKRVGENEEPEPLSRDQRRQFELKDISLKGRNFPNVAAQDREEKTRQYHEQIGLTNVFNTTGPNYPTFRDLLQCHLVQD